uniref:Uncharacterized protein n=1 Tax=Ditylenchus dipsaci TaxID=166011 RepID=A0A915EGZ0_9BILA
MAAQASEQKPHWITDHHCWSVAVPTTNNDELYCQQLETAGPEEIKRAEPVCNPPEKEESTNSNDLRKMVFLVHLYRPHLFASGFEREMGGACWEDQSLRLGKERMIRIVKICGNTT